MILLRQFLISITISAIAGGIALYFGLNKIVAKFLDLAATHQNHLALSFLIIGIIGVIAFIAQSYWGLLIKKIQWWGNIFLSDAAIQARANLKKYLIHSHALSFEKDGMSQLDYYAAYLAMGNYPIYFKNRYGDEVVITNVERSMEDGKYLTDLLGGEKYPNPYMRRSDFRAVMRMAVKEAKQN